MEIVGLSYRRPEAVDTYPNPDGSELGIRAYYGNKEESGLLVSRIPLYPRVICHGAGLLQLRYVSMFNGLRRLVKYSRLATSGGLLRVVIDSWKPAELKYYSIP